MRIAAFSTLFPPNVVGGAEKSVETLMLGLANRGAEVHVVTTDPGEDRSEREGTLNVHRVRLRNVYWPYDGTFRRPRWQRAFWHACDINNVPMGMASLQLLREIRPEVILTFNIQGFSPAIWRAVARFDRPLVHTIQDYSLLCPRTTMFTNGHNCEPSCTSCRLVTYFRRRSTCEIDAVVGISRAVLQRHKDEGLFRQVPIQKVIYNARPTPVDRKAASHRQFPLRIGFFGRVSFEKGFELLLNELASIEPSNWTLTVGGRYTFDYITDLKQRWLLNRVCFLGFIEPASFFRQIDLLVVPSLWHEPLGSVVIEAMSYGIPVIVSRRGGLPEMLDGAGPSGLVFDPDEPGSLRRLLGRFMNNPGLASALGSRMVKRAAYFSVQRQVESYVALLNKLANKKCILMT